jgi:glutaminyl-peptide cyclotransferase
MLRRKTHESRAAAAGLLALVAAALLCGGCANPSFDEDAAFSYLEEQCRFGPRPPGSAAHEETAEWLVETLRRTAEEVAVQRFTSESPAGETSLTNVIASFRVEERERVLLGAHWDTRAVAERDPDPEKRGDPILGANDGASGVAVLLALADLMAEHPPAVGVDIVLFDAEDGGNDGGLGEWCLGSSYYAATLGSYAPRYAVVIDMVGDRDLELPKEPNSVSANPGIVGIVWGAAERVGSTSFTDGPGRAAYDDHVPLIRAGIPTVLIIDFDYAHWHTTEDTPDKCSPLSLGEVGRVLVELIY